MLIFTLPSWYKTKKYPENSIFIFEQMMAIKELGHQVVVCSVQPVSFKKRANKEIIRVDDCGIITYYTEIDSFAPSKFRSIYTKQFKKALVRLVEYAKKDIGIPDVYYAHFSFAAGYCATLINDGIPLVVEEHYSGLMEKPDKNLIKIVGHTVVNSKSFICVSEGLKQSVKNLVSKHGNICVITNMINPCFTYSPRIEKDDFVFFSMGSLIKRKGFDILIKAFSEEFTNEENVILKIAGQGAEKENLESQISISGMQNRIQLIGQLSRDATLKEYQNCDCFVLASRAETYGLVYREAMAVGRPIISTKHGGFDEQNWDASIGYLVDIDDLEQIKKALRNIYDNYGTYNLADISNKCLNECSSTSVAKRIEGILISASRSN